MHFALGFASLIGREGHSLGSFIHIAVFCDFFCDIPKPGHYFPVCHFCTDQNYRWVKTHLANPRRILQNICRIVKRQRFKELKEVCETQEVSVWRLECEHSNPCKDSLDDVGVSLGDARPEKRFNVDYSRAGAGCEVQQSQKPEFELRYILY